MLFAALAGGCIRADVVCRCDLGDLLPTSNDCFIQDGPTWEADLFSNAMWFGSSRDVSGERGHHARSRFQLPQPRDSIAYGSGPNGPRKQWAQRHKLKR